MYGVIDIGSNTVRLSCYKVVKKELIYVFHKKNMAGLASYVEKSGKLSDKGIKASIDILNDFKKIVSCVGLDQLFVIATASFRNVSNTKEIVDQIYKNTGLMVDVLTGEEELDQLIGLDSVKRMVKKIKAYAKRNKGEEGFNLHMCFYGNPGTGKTEVARILSRILYDAGVLAEAKLVETDGHGLLGKFVGETAPKTEAKIDSAMGGVLFIDEAYALVGSHTATGGATNYGEEAIAVLLKEMEDRRGQFCTILAGYKDEMRSMLSANPGFQSRIQFTLDFPDYSRDELGQIAVVFLNKKKYTIAQAALELLLDVAEYYRTQKNFANARTIRNILDQVIMNQNLRTEDTEGDSTIIRSDVEDYIADENIDLQKKTTQAGRIGFI